MLVIRADASTEIGTGHVLRCLALAHAWQDAGGRAVFAMTLPAPGLDQRLQVSQVDAVRLTAALGSAADAEATADVAKRLGATWVVVDGYHFGADYYRAIMERGLKLLCIDDYGQADRYDATIVLNQNICASEGLYANRAHSTQLLLGTRYALLRREFWSWREYQRNVSDVPRRVLVTMGGSDANNCTLSVVYALQQLEQAELEVRLLVGSMNPNEKSLSEAIQRDTRFQIIVDAADMPALFAWADLAITAGGSTCWELAFLGLPAMAVVLADNQEPIARGLAAAGAVVDLGWDSTLSITGLTAALGALITDVTGRRAMSESGRKLVDGLGGKRVVTAMQETLSGRN